LTILSRHIPALRTLLPDGYRSVTTESLVPAELGDTKSGDEFVQRLAEFDDQFARLRAEAAEDGAVLRFVGVVDVAEKIVKAELARYALRADRLTGS
jgi:homoserine dehydrogenase